MEKIKALLYCTKSKPLLWNNRSFEKYMEEKGIKEPSYITSNDMQTSFVADLLNGKIVAECDYEVEKIKLIETPEYAGSECNTFLYDVSLNFETETLTEDELCKQSCLSSEQLKLYNPNYAIYIKNLKERVMELSDVYKYDNSYNNMFGWLKEENEKYISLDKAPQNMCRVWIYENGKWVMYILISVRPEWVCKILNGEKTIEVRKKVLKEMMQKCLVG